MNANEYFKATLELRSKDPCCETIVTEGGESIPLTLAFAITKLNPTGRIWHLMAEVIDEIGEGFSRSTSELAFEQEGLDLMFAGAGKIIEAWKLHDAKLAAKVGADRKAHDRTV